MFSSSLRLNQQQKISLWDGYIVVLQYILKNVGKVDQVAIHKVGYLNIMYTSNCILTKIAVEYTLVDEIS